MTHATCKIQRLTRDLALIVSISRSITTCSHLPTRAEAKSTSTQHSRRMAGAESSRELRVTLHHHHHRSRAHGKCHRLQGVAHSGLGCARPRRMSRTALRAKRTCHHQGGHSAPTGNVSSSPTLRQMRTHSKRNSGEEYFRMRRGHGHHLRRSRQVQAKQRPSRELQDVKQAGRARSRRLLARRVNRT